MSKLSESAGTGNQGFLSNSTRGLMNPNMGREGMPQLEATMSFARFNRQTTLLLETADRVRDAFIKSPKTIGEETDQMSPVLQDFLLDYPDSGVLTSRRGNTMPLDASAYRVGMQIAHRIYREAGILPEITTDDTELIRMRERASLTKLFPGLATIFEQTWQTLSDDGLNALASKVEILTAELPIQQRRSVEQAFRHLGSITGRKQRQSSIDK